ncbi:MAG: SPOR domain-containing protein [Candidatus Paracaedibacteraceae bacterium]|nr:SPOR domain-containing protein [Candidatus Paracaedibacteraceae bacterium]
MTPFFRKLQENDETSQPSLAPNPYQQHPERQPVNQDIRVGDVRATFGHVDRDEQIHRLRFMQEKDPVSAPEQDDEWNERQSPLNFVILASLVIILVVLGWFGYRWFASSYNEAPPILIADESPYKVRPDNPGGMVIPHQDKLIYGRITPQQQQTPERLLPQPEAPVLPEQQVYPQQQPVYEQQPQTQILYDQYGNPVTVPVYPQQHPMQQHQSHAPVQHPQPPIYAPQQQPVYQQNQQPMPQQVYPQQPSVAYAPLPVVAPQPVLPAPAEEPEIVAQDAESDVDPLDSLVSSEASRVEKIDTTKLKMASLNNDSPYASAQPVKKTSAKDDVKSAMATQGNYRVQLGSFSSEKEAKTEVRRLKGIDGSAFSGKKFIIQKSTSSASGKVLYKVMVGFFSSANQANTFKNKLKIHRVSGVVVAGKG